MNVKRIPTRKDFPGPVYTAIYARVSTQARTQLFSLANQMYSLTNLIAKDPDLRFHDIYVDVCSGTKNGNRENLERLLNDCRAGMVDYVITKSISRFARDTVTLLTIVRELRELGIDIYFENENIRSSAPEAELLISLIGAIAQAESDEKSQNIIWGIEKAAMDPDSKINNKIIYGYARDDSGNLIINKKEADTVKLIFALYMSGNSVLRIIDELKKKNIPTSRGKDTWSKRSIENILEEERYTGFKTISRDRKMDRFTRINYPTIIGRDVFLEAQDIIRSRKYNVKK